jgi:hypothetical protein
MQIERMTMVLRPRNAWEAADLGAAMLRAWWRPLYLAYACILVPVALAAHWLFDSALLALAAIWWLKPLYDRVLLHVMGRALFGATPTLRETLESLPALAGGTGLARALTLQRADPARSFKLPVRQLEGQSAALARDRERLLGRRMSAQTATLLYGCIAFETVVLVSAAGLLDLITPATVEAPHALRGLLQAMFATGEASRWNWIATVIATGAYFLIEPLYVAAGFALYLHRRTTLEAWDLELRFRRLQAAPEKARTWAAAMLAGIALGIASFAGMEAAHAAQPSSRELIREVLAAPEFAQYRTHKVWRPRAQQRDEAAQAGRPGWLAALVGAAAELVRLAAYAALAVALVFLLRFLLAVWRRRAARDSSTDAGAETPRAIFGLDVRPEALPADLAHIAARTADADPRLALSLLYRGALASLIHRDRLPIAEGDTEADCVRRVQATKPPALHAYFARLVAAWSQTAYGHAPPGPVEVRELCAQWPQHFGMAAP